MPKLYSSITILNNHKINQCNNLYIYILTRVTCTCANNFRLNQFVQSVRSISVLYFIFLRLVRYLLVFVLKIPGIGRILVSTLNFQIMYLVRYVYTNAPSSSIFFSTFINSNTRLC